MRPIGALSKIVATAAFMILGAQSSIAAKIGEEGSKNIQKPNFLIIVADDLGYTDIGAFGGEIRTPNLDALAKMGRRFSNFHVAPSCSATRSELLTGVDHHEAGLGNFVELMQANQKGKPGYEGHLNDKVVSVAQILKDSGYRTMMSGKWHVGFEPEHDPSAHGFQQSFTLLGGAHNHFGLPETQSKGLPHTEVVYRENGKLVKELPKNFYSSDFFTTKIIDYLGTQQSDKPFFAYLAFSAPHFPLQAPKEDIERYRNVYSGGWDELRQKRLARAAEAGVIPAGIKAHPMVVSAGSSWNELSSEEKQLAAKKMAVYAAMVDRLDQNVGRLIAHLKKTGQLDNTVILFMSDNGPQGGNPEKLGANGGVMKKLYDSSDNSLEGLGSGASYGWYGTNWAQASSAPFRLFKLFPTEGGTRVVSFLTAPGMSWNKKIVDNEFLSVKDVTPTILDLAGIQKPSSYNGKALIPYRGVSMLPYLTGSVEKLDRDYSAIGWEMFGRRAIRKGDWKAVFIPDRHYGKQRWELFNVKEDPAETKDMAAANPEKLAEMIDAWNSYEQKVGVVVPESPMHKE